MFTAVFPGSVTTAAWPFAKKQASNNKPVKIIVFIINYIRMNNNANIKAMHQAIAASRALGLLVAMAQMTPTKPIISTAAIM
jgi:hypothetical protein